MSGVTERFPVRQTWHIGRNLSKRFHRAAGHDRQHSPVVDHALRAGVEGRKLGICKTAALLSAELMCAKEATPTSGLGRCQPPVLDIIHIVWFVVF